MEKKLVAYLLTFLFSFSAHAVIEVFHASSSCKSVLLSSRTMNLEKSNQGVRTSIEQDPTQEKPKLLTGFDFETEVNAGLEKVRGVFQAIFEQRGMSEEEKTKILNGFEEADRLQLQNSRDNKNGLDNTAYFIRKNNQGEPISIVRATLIKKGEQRKLSCEKYLELEDGNRVELGRAYNNAPGKFAEVVANETMQVMAEHFKKYFASNNYTIYLLTDRPRAILYRRHYGFTVHEQNNLDELIKYEGVISGEDFYQRYVGHWQQAYEKAFFKYPFDKEGALQDLKNFEQRSGMKNYIPNLVAQTAILAAGRNYIEALKVSDQLKTVGYAQLNEDYNALYRSRIAYDPLYNEGEANNALQIIDDYLKAKKLALGNNNERALLFTVFKLKILLFSGNLEAAKQLLLQSKDLINSGLIHRQSYFLQEWDSFAAINKSLSGQRAARWRVTNTFLILDLGTHLDYISIGVLSPRLYRQTALDLKILGYEAEANQFTTIAAWLENMLSELNLPKI